MSKVIDLLKLPCLKDCFIIAGYDGIFNIVKRMDILETAFPEVEKFQEPHEFVFTSFWNLRKDKGNRINLVKSMIKHKCAGIGIMPSLNLDDEIDQEILDLGNACSFPIMYIPSHVRWSDIISEFSLLTNPTVEPELDFNLIEILYSFCELHTEKNIKKFCYQLNKFLSIPIIINADNIYSNGVSDKIISIVMSKLYSIKTQNIYKIDTPISLHVNKKNLSIAYYGKNSMLATCIDREDLNKPQLQVFHKIAPIVTRELDYLTGNKTVKTFHNKIDLVREASYYLVLLRKENIKSALKFINTNYIIYEENDFYNYIIFLIQRNDDSENSIFNEYNKIIEETNATLFIFSNHFSSTKELYNQIKILKQTVNSLLFLNGIFSVDELPILYMILNSPYEYKETVFKLNSSGINLDIELSFLDTLRLYLVLRNINDVSNLLGIHPNSVKYRISKCFNEFESNLPNALIDLPLLKLLLMLEIIKIEGVIKY